MQLDPENPFEAEIIKMVEINRRKKKDYAGDDHYLQNFYDSAYQLSSTAGLSCEALIATKQARLRVLLRDNAEAPSNESIEDTLLDRAVYAVLSLCLYGEQGYEKSDE